MPDKPRVDGGEHVNATIEKSSEGGRQRPPTEDLIRRLPLGDARAMVDGQDGGGGNTLTGYAAVFNVWEDIDSWEGTFREMIAPGAFAKTLAERGDRVKVLFNHGFDPTIGDKPLGKPSVLEEDSRGLKVEVPLDDTSYNRDLKESLRSGALDGMSFRFSVTREDWFDPDEGPPERTIHEVKLYELGPVTFPAYEATQAGIRTAAAFRSWLPNRTDAAGTFDAAVSTSAAADAARTASDAARTSDRAKARERELVLLASRYGIDKEED